jgi:hypothetical protein
VVDQVPGSNGELRYTVVSNPANGTLTTGAGGAIVYRPDSDFTGVDSFDYQVCDSGTPQQCSTGTVTLNVLPVARDDVATTPEDTPVRIAVLDNDTDGAPVTTTSNGPSHGTVTVGAGGVVTYTPAAGFTGADQFDYTICSPTEPTFCSTATARVTVTPVNHPPALGPLLVTTDVDTAASQRLSGSDPDSDPLTYRASGAPAHGTVTVTSTGSFVYRPAGGYAGHDSFPVVVCDDGDPQLCASAVVSVDVYPVAVRDRATTPPSTPVSIAVTKNDRGTHSAPVVVTKPASGTVMATGERMVYTPNHGFTGTDTFSYQICTPGAGPLCRTAKVTVVVTDDADSGSGSDSGSGLGSLPDTGGPSRWLGPAGAVLIAAGISLLAARRRLVRVR